MPSETMPSDVGTGCYGYPLAFMHTNAKFQGIIMHLTEYKIVKYL